MIKLLQQTALVLLLLSLVNGIFVKDDDYDNDSPRANNNPQNFHEVDAFGDDYVDFGAHTGSNGAFYWHANYPVEDHDDDDDKNASRDYSDEDSWQRR